MQHTIDMYITRGQMCDAMQKEIDNLEAELAELRKDKVRLDWLEGQKFGKDCLNYIGNTAREAIDNAMRGEK